MEGLHRKSKIKIATLTPLSIQAAVNRVGLCTHLGCMKVGHMQVRLTAYPLTDALREPPQVSGRANRLRPAWLSLVFAAG